MEAEAIDSIVAMYGPCKSTLRTEQALKALTVSATKHGAIVGGQTSCKAPEMSAFEKHLPSDVEIISCHSLHGPNVDPKGQPLVLIKHRASQQSFELVEKILSCFNSKHVHLTAEQHDRITADTQAVTHAAFLSMGTAWRANNQFPWEINRYVGGIENVKINVTLRIYSNKWHVYAGLAILNPAAKNQIRQYAQSVTELFKLMLEGRREELESRVKTAGDAVFRFGAGNEDLLLRDEVLDRFSLSKAPKEKTPNNHLSLLAMVDCWWKLDIVPYDHMICSTPVSPITVNSLDSLQHNDSDSQQLFRLWLGVTEYLFRKPSLLDEVITTAIEDNTFRSDDLEFTFAARVSHKISLVYVFICTVVKLKH